jgi:SAM-dependent methyltransferase
LHPILEIGNLNAPFDHVVDFVIFATVQKGRTTGMTESVPEIFSAFQCSKCGEHRSHWHSANHSAHIFGSAGRLMCLGCRAIFPVRKGYLDLYEENSEPVTPFQALMECAPIVDFIYEGFWRPFGYFIASKHSFPKDLDRIASLVPAGRGLILDLACGPGNFTRRIARRFPRSNVIGFDLSSQMLERAVRLTRKEGLSNVFYMRGSALALPFKSETFDAITCCGALQLFSDQEQAIGEIARVLKLRGDFVCQTTLGPRRPPLYVRIADRVLKFGYFYLDDLKDRLDRFNFDLIAEEKSNINYIFRAAKSG